MTSAIFYAQASVILESHDNWLYMTAGLALNRPGDLAISMGTSDTVSVLIQHM